MGLLLAHLHMAVPPYVRSDSFVISYQLDGNECASDSEIQESPGVTFCVSSPHGLLCPMPIVDRVEFSYPVRMIIFKQINVSLMCKTQIRMRLCVC